MDHIVLGKDSGVSISEQDLQEYYELNKDRYLQDEQRQARHILVLFDDDEEDEQPE